MAKSKTVKLEIELQEQLEQAIKDRDELRKQHDRTLMRLRRIERNREDALETLKETVWECFASFHIPPVPKPKKDARRKTPEIAIPNTGDWQFGKGTKTYDPDKTDKIIQEFGETTIKLTDIQRADHPVRECHINALGDLVEGEQIFKGQEYSNKISLYQQMLDGVEIFAKFVRTMASDFEKVHVTGVPGNHGSPGGPTRHSYNPETNFDRLLYSFTKKLIEGDKSIRDRVTWNIPEGNGDSNWYAIDTIGSKSFLLFHGQQTQGNRGVPFNSLKNMAFGWSVDAIPEHFDYLLCGHYHTPTYMTINSKGLWVVGSTESSNDYAQERLAAMGRPSQLLLFCHPENGVTAEYKVWLDREMKDVA